MDKKYAVTVRLAKARYQSAMTAIMPEIGKVSGRSQEKVTEDENYFYFYIRAPDTVSLRASLGAFTRLLLMVDRISTEVN